MLKTVDMEELAYHAHPAMSASDAINLLSKSPSQFRHDKHNPPERSKALDFGTAAHAYMLDDGTFEKRFEALPSDHNGRTKEGKAQVAAIREAGKTPIPHSDVAAIVGMARALSKHPLASQAFKNGLPERSVFWTCEDTGVECRMRLDWLPAAPDAQIFPDYKTARSVAPDDLQKAMWEHAYYIRSAWYQNGLKAAGVADPVYLMVFQAKTPPYEVVVVQPDETALQWGWLQCQRARRLFAEYTAAGRWPGYAWNNVLQIGLPGWADNRLQRQHENGDFAA
ncbi:MAG: PD-(D/E)XK nuclease-like domain-containing protein [Alphaproteobacteria bacterium]|nr:PD-(D/E)XK nuclease-like domain-containing protein [Alphaproteobacteria bacterium]